MIRRTLVFLSILCLCNGCYLIKQGGYLIKYQARARPINRLLSDSTLSEKNRSFFSQIERIRDFATDSIGLVRNKNYTSFVPVEKTYLVAVLSAADSVSFNQKKWCYPFFGCFPLRGYFKMLDAQRAGVRLVRQGYEINIDEVDGFSTLGIFSDPIYSFMADYPVFSLTQFIFHEQTHATVFFKNNVQFSEELATFIGRVGALTYLQYHYGAQSSEYRQAQRYIVDQKTYLRLLRQLYTTLGNVYRQEISRKDKLQEKKVIIESFKQRLVDEYDSLFITPWYRGIEKQTFNNAFLAVRMTYTLDLELFEQLYQKKRQSLRAVVEFMRQLKKQKGDPKELLKQEIASGN